MVRTLVKKGTAWLLLGLLFCQSMIFGVSAQQTARHPFYHVVLFASLKGEENPGYFDETLPSGQTRGQSILDSFAGSSPRSLTSYMRTVSEGHVELTHVFPQYDEKTGQISVCALPYTVAQAAGGNVDYGVMQYLLKNVDLSSLPVDGDGDGFIDNISVVLIGGADHTGTQIPTLYPMKTGTPPGIPGRAPGRRWAPMSCSTPTKSDSGGRGCCATNFCTSWGCRICIHPTAASRWGNGTSWPFLPGT